MTLADGIARHTPSLSGNIVVRVLAVDTALLPHIGEALSNLTQDFIWLEVGSTVVDTIAAADFAVESYYNNAMVGAIHSFLGTAPPGWLLLDGTTYDQQDYPELTARLDSQFRNDPAETFTLPDIRDRFVVGAGSSYALGDTGGAASHQLTVAELPSHTHTYTAPLLSADTISVGAPVPTVDATNPAAVTSAAGSDGAHENRPPYLAVVTAIFAGRV